MQELFQNIVDVVEQHNTISSIQMLRLEQSFAIPRLSTQFSLRTSRKSKKITSTLHPTQALVSCITY